MTQLLFCEIDCVKTHPDRGVFEFRGNGLREKLLGNLRITSARKDPEGRGTEVGDCLRYSAWIEIDAMVAPESGSATATSL
jgi:hypothetical protein